MKSVVLGVWVPVDAASSMLPPASRPMGRAVHALAAEGIDVVFGDQMSGGRLVGVRATTDRWIAGEWAVDAVQDRYPSQSRPQGWLALHDDAAAAGIPVGNCRSLTLLCRDKVRCQEVLAADPSLRLPPIEVDPAQFAARLSDWGTAFHKPRFGALGAGVRQVRPGDDLPATAEGVVEGRPDPALLQWAVPPPDGVAGRVLRVLAQRSPEGGWWQHPAVMRESDADPVVNAARGARVGAADGVLSPDTLFAVRGAVSHVCARLSEAVGGELALELGVDIALDRDGQPWVLEVNSRSRGRLVVLDRIDPSRFRRAHLDALQRPLRTLAAMVRAG